MKQTQQQQAQHLYFQTDMPKSQIADAVGISRRTLHYWIQQNSWDRLKKSAQYIPSFLAENCYQMIGNLTEHILSEERIGMPVTAQEAGTLYKLTLMINKIKNRPTLNESMELFGMFSHRLNEKNPALAEQVAPIIDGIIADLAHPGHLDARPAKMNDLGFIPTPDYEVAATESMLDSEDIVAWAEAADPYLNGQQAPAAATEPKKEAPSTPQVNTTAPKQNNQPAHTASNQQPAKPAAPPKHARIFNRAA